MRAIVKQVHQQPLEYLDISLLRQFLRHKFAELLAPKSASPDVERSPAGGLDGDLEDGEQHAHSESSADSAPAARDFERLLEDFVQLTFLVSPVASHTLPHTGEGSQRRSVVGDRKRGWLFVRFHAPLLCPQCCFFLYLAPGSGSLQHACPGLTLYPLTPYHLSECPPGPHLQYSAMRLFLGPTVY